MNLNLHPDVKVHVFPGGMAPVIRTHDPGSGVDDGYPDLPTRAVVSLKDDPGCPGRRETLYDFEHDPSLSLPIHKAECLPKIHQLRLHPRNSIILGCGIALDFPYEYAAFVVPRGSTIARGLTAPWATVPVDPGFRGEVVGEIYNETTQAVWIERHECLFQLVLVPRIVPVFVHVPYTGLSKSKRGTKNNGSTGKK